MENTISLENALVLKYRELTEIQRRSLNKVVLSSNHKPEYISKWLQGVDLSVEDAIYAVEVAQRKHISMDVMKNFLKAGYSVSQFVEFVEGKRELEGELGFIYMKESNGYRVDKSQILPYESLMIIDNLTGNTHDFGVIRDTISEISNLVDENEIGMGIAEIVYKLNEEMKDNISFPSAILRTLNIVPSDVYNVV